MSNDTKAIIKPLSILALLAAYFYIRGELVTRLVLNGI